MNMRLALHALTFELHSIVLILGEISRYSFVGIVVHIIRLEVLDWSRPKDLVAIQHGLLTPQPGSIHTYVPLYI